MNVQELAAKLRETAAKAEASLAREVVTEMTRTYVTVLKTRTPVLSGKLKASEYPDWITGDGAHAEAAAGPHTVYAHFRNDGGTIKAKRFPQLGNPQVGFFGKQVTQAGAHYMEKGHVNALASCHGAAQAITDRFLRQSGL